MTLEVPTSPPNWSISFLPGEEGEDTGDKQQADGQHHLHVQSVRQVFSHCHTPGLFVSRQTNDTESNRDEKRDVQMQGG